MKYCIYLILIWTIVGCKNLVNPQQDSLCSIQNPEKDIDWYQKELQYFKSFPCDENKPMRVYSFYGFIDKNGAGDNLNYSRPNLFEQNSTKDIIAFVITSSNPYDDANSWYFFYECDGTFITEGYDFSEVMKNLNKKHTFDVVDLCSSN